MEVRLDARHLQHPDILRQQGAEVCFDSKRVQGLPSAENLPQFECEEDLDLLLVIGGDGTILRAVRELKDFDIPILSVNRGDVGFLAEVTMEEAPVLLPRLLQGGGILDERSVLHITAMRGEETIFDGSALNEAVISQG
ncbi:MAG: NAD(+)/NADH kinase, partial [bacterium]